MTLPEHLISLPPQRRYCCGQEVIERVAKCTNLIITGAIFFCVVTLLYFIYYYYWIHERYFTSFMGPILSQAKAAVGAWGGTLYFVYLPAWGRYADPQSINKYSDGALYEARLRTRDQVLALVRTLGLPVIDIHSVFQAQSDPLALWALRHRFLHYIEDGHRLVAGEVLRVLIPDGVGAQGTHS